MKWFLNVLLKINSFCVLWFLFKIFFKLLYFNFFLRQFNWVGFKLFLKTDKRESIFYFQGLRKGCAGKNSKVKLQNIVPQ